ncbi:MAG: transporter permease [Actinomycetia bacterium]|nr:transporter permease [Actinomycetes bacterium]
MPSQVAGFALFLLRRLLGIAVLVWLVTLAAFGLFRLGVPSQFVDRQINAQLGAGESASWQYAHYLLRLLHGNLGESATVGLPVSTVLWRALPPTLSLVIGGMLLWLSLGFAGGMVSAARQGSWADRVINGAALTAGIIPTFLLAVLLLGVFSLEASRGFLWMQPGYFPLSHGVVQWLGRMILPWIAMVAAQLGLTTRLTRSAALEVLGEDYIRTAHAKGVSESRIFWTHVLRSAVIPVIPSTSVGLGALLGSAAIVDQTFTLGGIGQVLLLSVANHDIMVIMGTVLFAVILISLVNLIADIIVALLDPRVRLA